MLHGSLSCPKVRQKNPGWLGDIGDYTTQVYRDYNKPKDPYFFRGSIVSEVSNPQQSFYALIDLASAGMAVLWMHRVGQDGSPKNYMSHEKNPGWLGYIGDYTTQLYKDYDRPL